MAVEVTLTQLLELCSSDSRQALVQAYLSEGFHYLVIQVTTGGQWDAFGVGPREEVATIEEAEKRSGSNALATFFVACPDLPRDTRSLPPDAFNLLTRWAKELAKKEDLLEQEAAKQIGGPFTRERIELDARQNRLILKEKDLENRIRQWEEREKTFAERESALQNIDRLVEDEKVKRLSDILAREASLAEEASILKTRMEEVAEQKKALQERENYVQQSEERMMALTLEQQEQEARLEQMLDDIEKKKASLGMG